LKLKGKRRWKGERRGRDGKRDRVRDRIHFITKRWASREKCAIEMKSRKFSVNHRCFY
jgi:hypothetical protein